MSTEEQGVNIKVRLREYKGVLMGYNETEMIESMDTRDEDIWVCSYPRSGLLYSTFILVNDDYKIQ